MANGRTTYLDFGTPNAGDGFKRARRGLATIGFGENDPSPPDDAKAALVQWVKDCLDDQPLPYPPIPPSNPAIAMTFHTLFKEGPFPGFDCDGP